MKSKTNRGDIWDLIVVGGGISGLGAALRALELQPAARVLILEATDRWGGSVQTFRDPQAGLQWETGAGVIELRHRHVRAMVRRLGLTLVPLTPTPPELRMGPRAKPVPAAATAAVYKERMVKALRDPRYDRRNLRWTTFGPLARKVLGPDHAAYFHTLFGYDVDFEHAQAEETLRNFETSFRADAMYSRCKEGLSAIIEGMVRELRKYRPDQVDLRLRTQVSSIVQSSHDPTIMDVRGAGSASWKARRVILALPPAALEQVYPRLGPLLQASLAPVPMARIYAQFHRPWNLPRVATDGPLRQIIPVDPARGVALVGYNDMNTASYWTSLWDEGRGRDQVEHAVLKELQRVYGTKAVQALGGIARLWVFPWSDSIHIWRMGVRPETFRKVVDGHLPPGISIAGEAYSNHHAWMEGALTSGYAAAQKVFKKRTA